ncbi:Phosphodiesterase [Hexamita inflata]|uniref:Phosphodiesterase n=1 Tax=Hexamita inflata TaxID=28002 RepID=A0ABP1KZN4_9EUKA
MKNISKDAQAYLKKVISLQLAKECLPLQSMIASHYGIHTAPYNFQQTVENVIQQTFRILFIELNHISPLITMEALQRVVTNNPLQIYYKLPYTKSATNSYLISLLLTQNLTAEERRKNQIVALSDLVFCDLKDFREEQGLQQLMCEVFNEPQFQENLGDLKNSSTGMNLEETPSFEKHESLNSVYEDYFANRYPKQLNVQNKDVYFVLTQEEEKLMRLLDQTLEEWVDEKPTTELAKYVTTHFDSLSFDARHMNQLTNNNALLAVTYLTVKKLGLDVLIGINITNFFRFLVTLQQSYNPSLYHNSIHAADVTQMSYVMIKQELSSKYFGPKDFIAVVLACACHDLGHSGVDNPFIHKQKTKLHCVFPDVGPLEQIHASLGFQLIIDHNFYPVGLRELRIKFLELVLSTDMTFHFQFVDKLKAVDPSVIQKFCANKLKNIQAITLLKWLRLKMIVKLADISNPCRPVQQAEYWAYCYVTENRGIGSLKGPANDVQDYTKHSICQSQIGFINFVLKPFMQLILKLLGDQAGVITEMNENMETVLKIWEERKKNDWKGDF